MNKIACKHVRVHLDLLSKSIEIRKIINQFKDITKLEDEQQQQ